MKISIHGLGYVGAVCSACWSKEGYEVIGVDVYQPKVDLMNDGKSPIVEDQLGEFIAEGVEKSLLSATMDTYQAVMDTDISMICVGTPSRANGSLDLGYVESICKDIGRAMKDKDEYHIVVMRSTVLPGTAFDLAIPTLEKFSGKKVGVDFGYVSNPEFLRESTAIYDFYHPPKTVIGESDSHSGQIIADMYKDIEGPLIRVDVPTAEMAKYADNAWHAVKVSFGNEIGNIAKEVGVDGQKVMEVFCQDQKLNLSPYYLKPGFAFGGSCLPKDVRAITYKAKALDLKTPLLDSLMPSNEYQIERALKMIYQAGSKRVGFLGLSFKAGTDDLRESPLVDLVENLLGKGYEIKIYDKNVSLAALHGANKEYLMDKIPHISSKLTNDMDDLMATSDILIIGNKADEFMNVTEIVEDNHTIIDLVRASEEMSGDKYQGICW